MRHLYRVNTDGELTGCLTCPGGFTDENDPSDENNSHPLAIANRNAAKDNTRHETPYGGLVRYECPCQPDTRTCQCPYTNLPNFYCVGTALVEKPTVTVVINGVETSGTFHSLDLPPGTKVTIAVKGDVPDGHMLRLRPVGQAAIAKSAMELVFTGGITQDAVLVAPAQGMKGYVVGQSKYARPLSIEIRGWV